jgi:hypothetical protein
MAQAMPYGRAKYHRRRRRRLPAGNLKLRLPTICFAAAYQEFRDQRSPVFFIA